MRPPRTQAAGLAVLAVACASAFLLVGVPAALSARSDAGISPDGELDAAIATEINAARASRGLAALDTSGDLGRAARQHAVSMAKLGYFSHSSADGSSSTRRISSFYRMSGIHWSVGEVLLWATGGVTPSDVVARWLASSPHREELLGRWRELGTSSVHVAGAPGVFGGQNVTIVVVDFGRR